MLSYILLFSCMTLVFSYDPSCSSCKHFIPHFKNNPDLGTCKRFKDLPYTDNNNNILISNFALHCRNNENLCGKTGNFYEPNFETLQKKIYNDYEELNNKCCGEVNENYELDELEELEKELFELFQKMKKYNTKRIYKTSKDLYKLFKNK